MLSALVKGLLCLECGAAALVSRVVDHRLGLVAAMATCCTKCGAVLNSTLASNRIEWSTAGNAPFIVLRQAVAASMDMGVGHAGLVKLCRFLDMKPVTHTSFTQHAHVICGANKFVVTRMFDNAADVVRRVYRDTDPSIGEDDTIDLTISFDGAKLATFDHAISTDEKPQHDARWELTVGVFTRRRSPPCRSQDHVGRMWARHYRPTSQNTSGACTPDWHTLTCWNSASSGKRRTIMKVRTRSSGIQRWLRNDDEESDAGAVMCWHLQRRQTDSG